MTVIYIGLTHPLRQRHRVNPEFGDDLLQGHPSSRGTENPHHIGAEPLRERFWHDDVLSGPPIQGKPSQLSPIYAADAFVAL